MEIPLEPLPENSPLAVIERAPADYRIVRWAGAATEISSLTAEEAEFPGFFVGSRFDSGSAL
jgi:hypothetical protein